MIGESYAKTMQCVEDSFEGDKTKGADNSILREQAKKWNEYGTYYWPSIVINKQTVREDLTAENILEAICAGLKSKPPICIEFYKEENIAYYQPELHSAINTEVIIFVSLFLILVNVVLLFLYRRCARKEMESGMNLKVSSAVSQYIALS